jgi:hypothetical protein
VEAVDKHRIEFGRRQDRKVKTIAVRSERVRVAFPATRAGPPEGEKPAARPPVDRAREQRHAAMLSFATVLVLMLVVYVALFDADSAIEKVLFGAIVIGAIGVMGVVHLTATPARRLPHPQKVRREQRHVAMLTGVLGAVLLLLLYTAAFDLNSWSEWTVFGAIALAAVGTGIAVQTRMR